MSYSSGIAGVNAQANHIRPDIHVVSSNWYVNRCPLATRLPRLPVGSTTFYFAARPPRTRTYTLGAAVANNVVAQITFADATSMMLGDVIELDTGEHVEVTAKNNNTVVTVNRGVAGTTAAAQNNATTARLIGNSRTGAEVDQDGVTLLPTRITQFCQTHQHPVQVGGSLQAESSMVLQSGANAPFDQFKMDALQALMDDIETTAYYGKGEAPGTATSGRPKAKGLKTIIGNIVTSPTNSGAYKATDFIRDALEAARVDGGQPDVVLLSSNFMTGLATWGHAVQRIDAGRNVFGVPIDLFHAPFLSGVSIIEAPLLRPFTAIALTSSGVRMRMKRNEFWNARGNRGDAVEGEWIAEGAIELDNVDHHAWVEGVTAFAA